MATATQPAKAQAQVAESLAYLEARADQIRYAEFRAAGYPIGSGIVESANKLVIEARLKGSGMHWARVNVNPMVALRAALCSDRWAARWSRALLACVDSQPVSATATIASAASFTRTRP